MPKKPVHPTIYSPQTKADSVQAFARLIARAAVRTGQSQHFSGVIEPVIEQKHVTLETSVKHAKIEMCLKAETPQNSLFVEDV